jgi:hypothetical protein
VTFESIRRAVARTEHFLEKLRTLQPGQRIDLVMHDFQDMEFPIPPDERWTWAEKAEWLRARGPSHCVAWERMEDGAWVFERVKDAS